MENTALFYRQIADVLNNLKEEGWIYSYSLKESDFLVRWDEKASAITRINIIKSKRDDVDILPSSFVRKLYRFDTLNFYIVYGRKYREQHKNELQVILEKEAYSRFKGLSHEKYFLSQVENLIEKETSPVIDIKKTNPLEEMNGEGDFVVTFVNRASINIDIKSSDFGVDEFNKKNKKRVVALNISSLKERDLLDFFNKVYSPYIPRRILLGA